MRGSAVIIFAWQAGAVVLLAAAYAVGAGMGDRARHRKERERWEATHDGLRYEDWHQ